MTFKRKAALVAAVILASASAASAQVYVEAPGYYGAPYAAYSPYGSYGAYDAWGHFPVEDGASRESFGGY